MPLLLLYQNSIHVVGMTIACLVSQHSAMFESPGLFVVRRPSANSRWGGVQLIYYTICYAIAAVLLERDMSDPSLLLSTYPSSLDIDAQSVLQLFTHFLTISIHLNLEEGTSLICMCSYKDSYYINTVLFCMFPINQLFVYTLSISWVLKCSVVQILVIIRSHGEIELWIGSQLVVNWFDNRVSSFSFI